MDEIILVDKPAGITSFGIVARVRRVLSEKADRRIKVGHAGTLDPFATGLLILGVGKATKRMSEFLKLDKVYEATLKLGYTSTTGDPEGEIAESSFTNTLNSREKSPAGGIFPGEESCEEMKILQSTIQGFVGEITQTPPIYSAIKIHGQPAYKLARKGQTPTIPPRQVTIYDIKIEHYDYPELKLRVHCSSGTYVRTLAADIGQKLGTGAYLTALRRTKIGDFDIKDAKTLAELTEI